MTLQVIGGGALATGAGLEADAFDATIRSLYEPGFRLALVLLGSHAEAEDAVQEAVLSAWRHRGSEKPE